MQPSSFKSLARFQQTKLLTETRFKFLDWVLSCLSSSLVFCTWTTSTTTKPWASLIGMSRQSLQEITPLNSIFWMKPMKNGNRPTLMRRTQCLKTPNSRSLCRITLRMWLTTESKAKVAKMETKRSTPRRRLARLPALTRMLKWLTFSRREEK